MTCSEFAELAGLLAPKPLIIEAAQGPRVTGPEKHLNQMRDTAAAGVLETPALRSVQEEFERAKQYYEEAGKTDSIKLVNSGDDGQGPWGTDAGLNAFLEALGVKEKVLDPPGDWLNDQRTRTYRIS